MTAPEIKIENRNGRKVLHIEMECDESLRPSASGKSLILCTTHGNIPSVVRWNDQDIVWVSVNAYIKAKAVLKS